MLVRQSSDDQGTAVGSNTPLRAPRHVVARMESDFATSRTLPPTRHAATFMLLPDTSRLENADRVTNRLHRPLDVNIGFASNFTRKHRYSNPSLATMLAMTKPCYWEA